MGLKFKNLEVYLARDLGFGGDCSKSCVFKNDLSVKP
jgi:hypothetical protein